MIKEIDGFDYELNKGSEVIGICYMDKKNIGFQIKPKVLQRLKKELK